MEFKLLGDFIELDNLLKTLELAANGPEAKQFIQAGMAKVNNEVETRVRRKLHAGDLVEFGEHRIDIVT